MKILTMVATGALALVSFAATAAPPTMPAPGRTVAPRPAPLTGTGASYLKTTSGLIATAKSLRLKATISVKQRLKTAKPQDRTINVELAWAPGDKFMAHNTGMPGGEGLLIGSGGTAYIYSPSKKSAIKMVGNPPGRGRVMVMRQLEQILSGGPTNWTYDGVRKADGRSCDVVTGILTDGKGSSKTESIYLDRATHLPRKVSSLVKMPQGMVTTDISVPVFQVNAPLPNSMFNFRPPAGVKVMTPQQAGIGHPPVKPH